ncbi:MAG: hypothetical protein ACYCOX_01915, partial [Acidobacteriaceae bacterium]
PTQVSPILGLTIQALAARTSDYLSAEAESIFTRKDRDMMQPATRRGLSPPGPFGRGIPRMADVGLAKQ